MTYVGELLLLLLFCHSPGFKLLELPTRAALLKPGQTITGSIVVTITCIYGNSIRNAIKCSIDS